MSRAKHIRITAADVVPGDRVMEPDGPYISAEVRRTIRAEGCIFIETKLFDLLLAPKTIVSVWRFL